MGLYLIIMCLGMGVYFRGRLIEELRYYSQNLDYMGWFNFCTSFSQKFNKKINAMSLHYHCMVINTNVYLSYKNW